MQRFALVVLLLPHLVSANVAQEIETIVVTGSLTAKSQFDSPVRTELVSSQELSRTHAKSLKDALENVAGLHLSEIHGKSGYQVSLQGLSSDQVLVLLDGLPVTSSTNSTTDVSQFSINTLDRIEVVKGASSSQYGSAAMGGVINMISKVPERGFAIDAQLDVGSYGTQNPKKVSSRLATQHGQAVIEGGFKTLRGRLSVDQTDDSGFSIEPKEWSQQGDKNKRQHYTARVDWLPSKSGSFWLDTQWYKESTDSRYARVLPPNRKVPQQKTEDVDKYRVAGGASWQWQSGWHIDIKAMQENYQSQANEFSNFFATDDRQAKQQLNYVTGQLSLPYWLGQGWTIGASYHQEDLSQSLSGVSELAAGKVEREAKDIFAESDIYIGEKLEILLGGRWQDDSDFGQHAVPKISLRYHIDIKNSGEIQLRSSFGQGYRVPTLKERYFLFDHSALGYQVIGNPLLKPEKSDSWQLGLDYQWQDKVSAELNLFYNSVRDLIQIDQTQAELVNGISYFSYTNIGKAETKGIETAMRWQPINALQLNFAYTFTQTKDTYSGAELTRRPKHIARLGWDWTWATNTTLSIRQRYQSKELVDSQSMSYSPHWLRTDLSINQELPKGFKAFLGIKNLLNKQRNFQDVNDFSPIAGRYIYVGFRYQWQHQP